MNVLIHRISGLHVYIEQDPTGGCYAVVPALPGCGSQGESEEEVLENLNDAIMAVLEVMGADDPARFQALCGSTSRLDVDIDAIIEGSTSRTGEIVRLLASRQPRTDGANC